VIAGILLAAGLSRRMGRPKLLLPIEGRAVVRHAAEHIVDAGIERVIAVVGDEEAAVRSALAGLPIEIVVNPNPAAGQATSLVAGVEAVAPDVTAALIALGDQPFVPVSVIRGLIDAFERTSFAIAAPRHPLAYFLFASCRSTSARACTSAGSRPPIMKRFAAWRQCHPASRSRVSRCARTACRRSAADLTQLRSTLRPREERCCNCVYEDWYSRNNRLYERSPPVTQKNHSDPQQ